MWKQSQKSLSYVSTPVFEQETQPEKWQVMINKKM